MFGVDAKGRVHDSNMKLLSNNFATSMLDAAEPSGR